MNVKNGTKEINQAVKNNLDKFSCDNLLNYVIRTIENKEKSVVKDYILC